jgi:predicted ArsR family transcriptional regulator
VPRRVDDFRGLTQPRRLRLLRAVQREPGRTAQGLADECGIPLNTARDHLHVLEEEGLVRSETVRRGTRGRPPVVFHPVREAASSVPAERRVTTAREHGAFLRSVTRASRTVPDDGAQAQLDVLYEHLDDAGLEPQVDEEGLVFELAPCRYHDLIAQDRALVCSVHARLVGDVLRQVDGPLALKRLEPFVTEHSCRLALAHRDAPGATTAGPA